MGELPPSLATLVGLLVVAGGAVALIGSLGLLRLATFYERVHPPTMGTTLGTACIVLACILLFSVIESRLALEALLIPVFAFLTTPVTYMLLVRAAVRRDQKGRNEHADPAGDA